MPGTRSGGRLIRGLATGCLLFGNNYLQSKGVRENHAEQETGVCDVRQALQ